MNDSSLQGWKRRCAFEDPDHDPLRLMLAMTANLSLHLLGLGPPRPTSDNVVASFQSCRMIAFDVDLGPEILVRASFRGLTCIGVASMNTS